MRAEAFREHLHTPNDDLDLRWRDGWYVDSSASAAATIGIAGARSHGHPRDWPSWEFVTPGIDILKAVEPCVTVRKLARFAVRLPPHVLKEETLQGCYRADKPRESRK